MAALTVLQALGALAGLVSGLKNIFDDAHDQINEKLDEVLGTLQGLRQELILSTAEILEAIDGIRRQINEDVALDNIILAEAALFNDLVVFKDKEAAMRNSFLAADRLSKETDIVFASPFIYVVCIRLAVLKDFDPSYYCRKQFQQEFQGYIGHLRGWIAQINDLIARSNTVRVVVSGSVNPKTGLQPPFHWVASYLHNGVTVREFLGPQNDTSDEARNRVEREANASRLAGIAADRRQFGVIDMENTAAAWEKAFTYPQRTALVSQVLNRPTMAIDFNPDGLMVDGRIVPASPDLTTLMELLISREFRNRVQKVWDAFMNRSDDRLVQFALRRLFSREASDDEIALLHGIASSYGYAAFIAALLYSKEYEERYGRGLPTDGQPIIDALKVAK